MFNSVSDVIVLICVAVDCIDFKHGCISFSSAVSGEDLSAAGGAGGGAALQGGVRGLR